MAVTNIRVLIVCEAFSLRASGGRAALAVALGLRALGAEVRVATFYDPDGCSRELKEAFEVTFLGRGSIWRQRLRQIVPLGCMNRFRELLGEFRPQVVHFSSFDFDKSHFLISAAKKAKAS